MKVVRSRDRRPTPLPCPTPPLRRQAPSIRLPPQARRRATPQQQARTIRPSTPPRPS